MKKYLLVFTFLFVVTCSYSQQLGQVTFFSGANLSYISFFTDQDVLIRVTDDGKVTEWGIEVMSQRGNNYYAPQLQPFMGRVEYFGPESDSAFIGKLKSIGTCFLTYYGHYEIASKAGKLRSVGTVLLDYYDNYDNKEYRGKIKFVGNQMFEYYSSFEDAAYRGKLKSIGNTAIKYYSSFEDKLIKGKIKSIGPVSYTWYTSADIYRGGLKSGSYRTTINGVTYILW